MAVTPHHYSFPLRSIVNQGYSPSMHTPDPVETFTLWLTGDLRVCSLSSWDPHPSPFRCPLLCFLLSLPIRKFTHTQISSFHHMMCILIAAISLLCQCESQSFPTWPFLREQTSGDTILNCLAFSIRLLAAQLVLLQGQSFQGGWAYLLFWFCLLLWLCLIYWYAFRLWFSFLQAQEQKKQFGFLVLFTFFDWVSYDRIFCLKVPFIGLLSVMVIFRALKYKRRVFELRKGYNIWVGREISWKGMWADEGFWQARAV